MALGPTQPPTQWVPGVLSLGVKRRGREADHSPPSNAEVRERVELYFHSTNTPPWRGAQLKHRDNLTYVFALLLFLRSCLLSFTYFLPSFLVHLHTSLFLRPYHSFMLSLLHLRFLSYFSLSRSVPLSLTLIFPFYFRLLSPFLSLSFLQYLCLSYFLFLIPFPEPMSLTENASPPFVKEPSV
jgi:hypothetical protein